MPSAAPSLLRLLLPLVACLACGAAQAQAGRAHVHGEAALEIVVEPRAVSLRLELPQDSLLGHERLPRSTAEREAAAAALKALQDGARLFALPAGLRCRPAGVEVDAPLLQSGASAGPAATDGHAEVEARYRFDCERTDGLRSIDLGGLLDSFPRLQRIGAQVADGAGQHKAQLRRPARTLAWGR